MLPKFPETPGLKLYAAPIPAGCDALTPAGGFSLSPGGRGRGGRGGQRDMGVKEESGLRKQFQEE